LPDWSGGSPTRGADKSWRRSESEMADYDLIVRNAKIVTEDRQAEGDIGVKAGRIAATTYEIQSSHMMMLSHPEFVIDVIKQAAHAVQNSSAASAVAR